jgi:hypothetical protein
MGLANSVALRLAGITEKTPDPPGGTVVRDAEGNPTGALKDAATDYVYKRVAEPSPNTAYARSRMSTRRSNVFVSKSGCTSIRRPPGSPTASPQLGSCCFGDFLAANSTGTKRPVEEMGLRLPFQRSFFGWRSSVLKLKPRLWQNSLRRIPLLTNSATNC